MREPKNVIGVEFSVENFSLSSAKFLWKLGNINPFSAFGRAIIKMADTRQPNKFKISVRKMRRGKTVRPNN